MARDYVKAYEALLARKRPRSSAISLPRNKRQSGFERP